MHTFLDYIFEFEGDSLSPWSNSRKLAASEFIWHKGQAAHVKAYSITNRLVLTALFMYVTKNVEVWLIVFNEISDKSGTEPFGAGRSYLLFFPFLSLICSLFLEPRS